MSAPDTKTFVLGDEEHRRRVGMIVVDTPPDWLISISPPRRTIPQNRLLHGLLAEAIKGGLSTDDGRRLTIGEARTAFMSGWMEEMGLGSDIIAFSGRAVQLRRSTTELTPSEFSSLVEYIRAECFHRGIPLSEARP